MSGTEAARSARDAAVLQSVTAALSGAHDVQSVARVICEIARTGIGAAGCFVARFDADTMVMLGTGGLTLPTSSAYAVLPLDAPLPPMEALRTRRPVTIRTRAERDERFPAISGATDDHGSFIALPMLDRTRVVGVVNFSWQEEGGCDGVSEPQLLALASQCGQALERARLYDAEAQARQSAEAAVDQLRMLQSLTARLSSAPDGRAVASTILDTLLRVLGGVEGAVYRVDEIEDGLQLLGCRALTATFEDFIPLSTHVPATEAVRANATIPPLVPPFLPGPSETVWTPLHLSGRVVGVIAMSGHDRAVVAGYDPTFLSTVTQLFAQALERAELYDTSHDIALTLQNSMLPRRLPVIQGLEIAVRYRPVGGRTVVGGDFYDVFRVGPGRWGVMIGDVSGKGVRAASLTALARYTVRAVAVTADIPSDVLGALNTAVLDWEDGEDRFCTAAYLDVEPGPDGAAVRVAVGGHPLPTLRTAAGAVSRVGVPGMALGLLPLAEVNDAEVFLSPGDVLVLVTDGITEARTADGVWVEDAVDRALSVGLADVGEDAEAIADRIERIVLDVQAGRPRDDLAVVVLRAPTDVSNTAAESVSMSMTLECEARSVAEARRRVTELLGDRAHSAAAEVLELLVSEVVTNAVVHARSAVGLRVAIAADRAHVEVTDSSPRSPVRRDARMDSLGGRGLLLLDRLAAAWGVRRRADGKVVWFDVDL